MHMTHIEDKVIYGGVKGTRMAINALRELRNMLKGEHDGSVSVKWDGAPAIFAGIDPGDGKFFVAKKGIFNKNPKVYKTDADVDADTTGDLAAKLKQALQYLPALGIKNVSYVSSKYYYVRCPRRHAGCERDRIIATGDCLAHILHRIRLRINEGHIWCRCIKAKEIKSRVVTRRDAS